MFPGHWLGSFPVRYFRFILCPLIPLQGGHEGHIPVTAEIKIKNPLPENYLRIAARLSSP
jgi:hypothetical protein